MLKKRYVHEAVAATEGRRSTAACTSQQTAAAWAWFEHAGGSTCLTPPSKAAGLIIMAAKRNAKCNFAGPSRFMKELLDVNSSTAAIPQHSADASIAKDYARRRHSFQDDDDLEKSTSYIVWRFSSSCRNSLTSPARFMNIHEGPDRDNEGEGEEASHEASSHLLDNFEIAAVCRQLHDHLGSSGSTPVRSCTNCSKYDAHMKALADTEHHQNINDVVHWLPRLRIKLTSTSSPRRRPSPALCSSIATADSIVDRHHAASPKQFRAGPPINQTSKRHDRSNKQNIGRLSNLHSGEWKREDEGSAAGRHKRGEFGSSHRKAQQKMAGRSELELIGGAPPSRIVHHSDLKVLQPPMSTRLPHMSALLGHNMHGAPSTDDGVAHTSNRHHHHIHHYHYHYHHLQHQASQDACMQ